MKMLRLISCWCLLALLLTVFLLPGVALAQDEAGSIILSTEFPKLDALATGGFDFSVTLAYTGPTDRVFNLDITAPAGWDTYITPAYDTTRISSITMEKSVSATTSNTTSATTSTTTSATSKAIKVTVTPPSHPLAEPGEYNIKLKASSDVVVGEITLTARVTARYELTSGPANQRYDIKAKAGQDNIFSIIVGNSGTATIDNITFSSDKPDGWEITFNPGNIDLLDIVNPATVSVNIKPPSRTVAGDYMITLRVSGTQASASNMDIRVTVTTPAIWGWLGVGIIAVVVIGLIFVFIKFGRR